MDYTPYPRNEKMYAGAERKFGITIEGVDFIVKFQTETAFDKRNNHISEYLGSHIFDLLGVKAQETHLGTYDGKQVVVCRDFNQSQHQFVPFNDVGESSIEEDRDQFQYSYDDIMAILRANTKLTNVSETVDTFWDIYIIDALLGNFDRHGSNWGFLKYDNRYTLAPVFDNGSCLYPRLVQEDLMNAVMESAEETNRRIFQFPTSQIQLDGQKSSYFEIINSLAFKECNEALIRVYSRISIPSINRLINETPYLSETQRFFYKYIIRERYFKIIQASYKKLMGGKS